MPDTHIVQLIAKNVRMQMVKRDVSHLHVANKLKLKDDQVKARLNGKIPFSDDELEMLAPYLDTSFEALHMDLEIPASGKAGQNSKPVEFKEPEKTALSRQRSAVPTLIGIIDKREDLKALVVKMFLATLSGKIPDLAYILRNNLLVKARKDYDGTITEDEKVVFINHYLDEFERYKNELIEDIDEVIEVALTTNALEAVQSVILPSGKSRFTQFLGMLAKDCSGEEKEFVDMQKLNIEVGKALAHLQRVKGLLEDYLDNQYGEV